MAPVMPYGRGRPGPMPRSRVRLHAACSGAGRAAGVERADRWQDGGVRLALLALAGAGLALCWPTLPGVGVRWLLLAGATAVLLWGGGRSRWWVLPLLGMGWTWHQAGQVLDHPWPDVLSEKAVWLEGQVVDLPRHLSASSRFVLRVDQIDGKTGWGGRLVELHWRVARGREDSPLRTQVSAGERWRLMARVRPPRTLLNPGGFDTERHALANRIQGTGWVQPEGARRLEAGRGLTHWRAGMSARIPLAGEGRFIRALALGDTRQLTQEDWQLLRSTGLTHLVAISGFHVTLMGVVMAALAGGLWRMMPRLGRHLPRPQAQVAAALGGALVYAAASGLGLPAVRTVLMVAVVCLARWHRRTVTVWQCLAWALMAVLIVDPLALLAAGFWLSYAGVAWLAWALGASSAGGWRGLLVAQAVATAGLLPMSVFLFGQASLVGPLANLLAIPWWSLVVVPLCVLGLGLETLLQGSGGWAWWLAGKAFAPSWRLFAWMGRWPLAEIWVPESGLLSVALALAGTAWMLLPKGTPVRLAGSVLWLPLLWPHRELPVTGSMDVHMLDVGQGQAVIVRTSNHVLLYDAGPAVPEGFDAGERVVVPAFQALGIHRLDALVVSHGDNDHAGGAASVLARYPAADEVYAPAGLDSALPVTHRCERGMAWEWDRVQFRFLHPTPFFPYAGNESSCVLQVTTKGGALLLTGDIGRTVENRLIVAEGDGLRSAVVSVPHHGSAGSSSGRFIRAVSPALALVSAGKDNRFGHPHPTVVTRWQAGGAEVATTADRGAIRVWMGPGGTEMRERRQSHRRLWHRGH